MAPETLCQQVLEELLSRRPLSGALAAHLATCPTCAQARQTLEGLKTLPSAWSTAPSAALQQKIMRGVADAGLLKPAATSAAPQPPAPAKTVPNLPFQAPGGSLTTASVALAMTGGAILLGLLVAFSGSPPSDRPTVSPKPVQVASPAAPLPGAQASTTAATVATGTAHQAVSDPESDRP